MSLSDKNKDISALLKEKIKEIDKKPKYYNVGKVLSFYDDIINISGLHSAFLGEIVKIGEYKAIIVSLERSSAIAILLDIEANIFPEDEVISLGESASIPVSMDLVGRVVDPLCNPLDNGPCLQKEAFAQIYAEAPSMMDRIPVNRPLSTGIRLIDCMIPIGKGQRELIVGDRGIGKTQIAVDSIVNQKNKDVYCIYACISQKKSSVIKIFEQLLNKNAMDYSIIVSSSPSDSCAMQYLTPFSACAIAEYLMKKGKDVLIVYDDLTKHAWAYRQMCLLLKRYPGRDAYPGDIFSLHANLLERAANVSSDFVKRHSGLDSNGGSITALPIVELQEGDISGYVPTNIISITDGQIYLSSSMFASNLNPAIDSTRSVSRIGGIAQLPIIRSFSADVKLFIAQYRELAYFVKLASSLDENSQKIINRGRIAEILFTQKPLSPASNFEMCFELYALNNGHLDHLALNQVKQFIEVSINSLKKDNLHKKQFNNLEDMAKAFFDTIKQVKEMLS